MNRVAQVTTMVNACTSATACGWAPPRFRLLGTMSANWHYPDGSVATQQIGDFLSTSGPKSMVRAASGNAPALRYEPRPCWTPGPGSRCRRSRTSHGQRACEPLEELLGAHRLL
jgi:hypothetical protein